MKFFSTFIGHSGKIIGMKKKQKEEKDLSNDEFVAVSSMLQHEIKLVIEKFRYALPIACQSVLAETLMELIFENENPDKCFDITITIMDLRMKKFLRENLCEECRKGK